MFDSVPAIVRCVSVLGQMGGDGGGGDGGGGDCGGGGELNGEGTAVLSSSPWVLPLSASSWRC